MNTVNAVKIAQAKMTVLYDKKHRSPKLKKKSLFQNDKNKRFRILHFQIKFINDEEIKIFSYQTKNK